MLAVSPRVAAPRASRRLATAVGAAAAAALRDELRVHPKPGLVSPADSGSHADMDAALLSRSIDALEPYFAELAAAGAAHAGFARLRAIGVAAEASMLRATGGVNAHRGAIFALGLLAAAAGHAAARGEPNEPARLGARVRRLWGDELRAHRTGDSHGSRARERHRVGGALGEAIAGFPGVTEGALPALTAALAAGLDFDRAAVQALFLLLTRLDDTNLLHRGGREGLALARERAREFLAAGGVQAADWRPRALAVHREFVALRLSPGGCADALAAAIFLHRLRAVEA